MQANAQPSIVPVALRLLRNYIKNILSVPAVVLHFYGFCFGVFGLFYLITADRPELVNTLILSIMGLFDVEHVSYQGNPIPFFLTAFLVIGLLLDMATWIIQRVFHIQWRPGFWKTFGALCLFSGINYSLTWLAFLKSPKEEQGLVMLLVFFALTTIATFFALGSAYVLDHVKIGAVPTKLSSQAPVVGKNT